VSGLDPERLETGRAVFDARVDRRGLVDDAAGESLAEMTEQRGAGRGGGHPVIMPESDGGRD
jgi:hypothetical protein